MLVRDNIIRVKVIHERGEFFELKKGRNWEFLPIE